MRSHPHLILLGFPGSGKSTLARHLANHFDVPCLDIDTLVENLHGQNLSSKEITQKEGLETFRSLEKRVVLSLPRSPPSIIATGGGTALDPDNLTHLRNIGMLLFLHVDHATLQERWKSGSLPSFVKNSAAFYDERLPRYQAIDCKKIDLSGKTPEEATAEITHLWSPHG